MFFIVSIFLLDGEDFHSNNRLLEIEPTGDCPYKNSRLAGIFRTRRVGTFPNDLNISTSK
jgi:hypothetical protein